MMMNEKTIFLLITVSLIMLFFAAHQPKANQSQHTTDNQSQQMTCCPAKNFGAIEGHVYDPDGQPVAKATVYAERIDALMHGAVYGLSDSEGKFLIEGIPLGTYILYAAKEEDGYARTTSRFYYRDDIVYPQAIVQEQQTTPNVIVSLRPKLAQL